MHNVAFIEEMSIPEPNTGCWLWLGNVRKDGYGQLKDPSRKKGAYNAMRASWIAHNGAIEGKRVCVCHACDNRGCVNPEHLFLGSNSENMQDCSRKGRINRGEDRPQSKLTEDKVREIRFLASEGVPTRTLAEIYGVASYCISSAVKRITWKHVE